MDYPHLSWTRVSARVADPDACLGRACMTACFLLDAHLLTSTYLRDSISAHEAEEQI